MSYDLDGLSSYEMDIVTEALTNYAELLEKRKADRTRIRATVSLGNRIMALHKGQPFGAIRLDQA